jgi:uncharacterized membrane protein
MQTRVAPRRSVVASAVYGVLDPASFGFFVGGLVFDVTYAVSANVLWAKSASWLITLGLLLAVAPRVINLVQVWVTSRHAALRAEKLDFWLNLVAIVAAVFNAFVHTRDAYSIVPANVWLSVITVVLLVIARIVMVVRYAPARELIHE